MGGKLLTVVFSRLGTEGLSLISAPPASRKESASMPRVRRKSKPGWLEISDEEEARIQAGIARDPDNPEWTEADFKRAQPLAKAFPELAESMRKARVNGRLPGQRGPGKKPKKELVSLRLDPDVVAHFRATGERWQTRINETLKKAIAGRKSGRSQ
jgi:uncharacterized protein (DUF4415 family)